MPEQKNWTRAAMLQDLDMHLRSMRATATFGDPWRVRWAWHLSAWALSLARRIA